jgi:DNA sulfur modification protein DndD
MKFLKLNLKNFMPFYGEEHEIKFPTDEYKNILLVHGYNTYGKTSILRSLRWALYGHVSDKFDREISYLDLLNRTSAKEGKFEFEVVLDFQANDSVYQIIRNVSSKESINNPFNNNDFIHKSWFKKDGNVLPNEDAEHEINLIAPEPVSRFFLFDGELLKEYEHLLEEDSEVGKKVKDSIEQILGVPSLSNGRNDTSTLSKKYRAKQNKELKKTNVSDLSSQIEEIDKKILLHEKEISDLNTQKTETQSKIDTIAENINNIEEKSKIANQISEIRDEISKIKDSLSELEDKRLEATSTAWKLLLKPKLLKIRKESLNSINTIVKQFEKVGALDREISLLSNLESHDHSCEICNTKSPNLDSNTLIDKKNKIQEELNLIKINPEFLDFSKINSNQEIIDSLLNLNEERTLKSLDDEIDNLSVQLVKQEGEEIKLRSDLGDDETVKEINDEYKKMGGFIKVIENLEILINTEEESIKSCEKQIKQLESLIKESEEAKNSPTTKYVSILSELNDIFSNSIDHLRDELKKEVEQKASEAFSKLIHRKIYDGLRINNNYGLQILNRDGDEVPMKSSGAEQIVALSLIDALSRTGRDSGPVVMDTPFGRLDDVHREKIVEYLPESASQLMLFVHKGETNDEMLEKMASQIGSEYKIDLQDDDINSLIRKMN